MKYAIRSHPISKWDKVKVNINLALFTEACGLQSAMDITTAISKNDNCLFVKSLLRDFTISVNSTAFQAGPQWKWAICLVFYCQKLTINQSFSSIELYWALQNYRQLLPQQGCSQITSLACFHNRLLSQLWKVLDSQQKITKITLKMIWHHNYWGNTWNKNLACFVHL